MNPIRSTGSCAVIAKLWRKEPNQGQTGDLRWQIAEEVAVAILVNSRPTAVVMATPVNLKDLGIGFLLSEQYLSRVSAVRSTLVMRTDKGFCVDVGVDPKAINARPERVMESRSSCGLCGLNTLTDVSLKIPFVRRNAPEAASVARAFARLHRHQPMKAVNRSVHGAAFANFDGDLLLVREDIGRHNALDKLIGALTREGTRCSDGFVVMTSRCSFELVQKAAIAGFSALATISAPTQLALETARVAGLSLASTAPDGIAVFGG